MLKIIDFWWDGCQPCKSLEPQLKIICEKYNLELEKINVMEDPESASLHGIKSTPTLIIEKDGANIIRLVGSQECRTLETVIKNLI